MEWELIDERLVRARFNSRYCELTIIVCYAQTNDDSEVLIESPYGTSLDSMGFQRRLSTFSRICTDMSAQSGITDRNQFGSR